MPTPGTNPTCWAAHMGLLACEPRFVERAVAAAREGLLRPRSADEIATGPRAEPDRPYLLAGDGVAVLRIDGPTAKGWGKFGEFSTVFARRALRAALADSAVGSIVLVIDSPGGYVAGTDDLARDVAAVNTEKPVVAYAEDLMASAAYWVASQARAIYANPTAQVGSIGVFAVVYDSSALMEAQGVKVHVLSTGPLKGAGADGAPVTPEHVAAWQTEVDDTMAHFVGAVRKGRSLTPKQLEAVTTGGVWIASKAKDLGLIDGIKSLDAVVAGMPRPRRERAQAAVRIARASE